MADLLINDVVVETGRDPGECAATAQRRASTYAAHAREGVYVVTSVGTKWSVTKDGAVVFTAECK